MNKKDLLSLIALGNIAINNVYGFTVDKETLKPITRGYSVAVKDTQNSFGLAGMAGVYQYAKDHENIDAFGGWLNTDNNQYYFDAVIICDDLKTALELGRINNQIAIFDLCKLQEIKIKY